MPDLSEKAWIDFSASAAWLQAETERIHREYLNKWIGVYKSRVEADADSFDGVMEVLAAKNISAAETLIRFIGQKELTLVL
jgi:hypothetical protein